MDAEMTAEKLDVLIRQAGLTLTDAQAHALLGVYPLMAAMAARLRTPDRGRDAEPGHIFVAG